MPTKYSHPVKYNKSSSSKFLLDSQPVRKDINRDKGLMANKTASYKLSNGASSDGIGDDVCRMGSSSFSEIFISSSKLVSIYTEKVFSPPTDIFETDKEFVIRSEIAGMKPEEIIVSFDGNRLMITGSRDERDNRTKRTFRQMEIDYGKFEKVIEIYCGVEAEQSTASYKDGFLEIVIPKTKKSGQIPRPNGSSGRRSAKTTKHIEITLGKI